MRKDENYMNDSTSDNIFVDTTGKQVKISNDEELGIREPTPLNCNDDYKDALLASLYSQVEFLRNELVEQTFLIRTLTIKDANHTYTNHDKNDESINTTIENADVRIDSSGNSDIAVERE